MNVKKDLKNTFFPLFGKKTAVPHDKQSRLLTIVLSEKAHSNFIHALELEKMGKTEFFISAIKRKIDSLRK